MTEVVAARAAKRARSGGWGGGVRAGPAHSKKEGCLNWLFFPPPPALRELDPAPARDSETAPALVPVLLDRSESDRLPFSNYRFPALLPDREFRAAALVFDEPDLLN